MRQGFRISSIATILAVIVMAGYVASVGASLYLHSFPLAAGAFAVAAVVAVFTICSGKPHGQKAQQ